MPIRLTLVMSSGICHDHKNFLPEMYIQSILVKLQFSKPNYNPVLVTMRTFTFRMFYRDSTRKDLGKETALLNRRFSMRIMLWFSPYQSRRWVGLSEELYPVVHRCL